MGFNRSFTLGVLLRLLLIFSCGTAAIYLATLQSHFAATLVMALASLGTIISLINFVGCSNRDMVRFVDAISSGDLAQSFSARHSDGYFAELADSLQSAMDAQRAQDQQARQQALLLSALIDDAPVALLRLEGDRLLLLNKMARHLLGKQDVVRLDNDPGFGDDFHRAVKAITPGERKLISLRIDGNAVRAMLIASQVRAASKDHFILSLQPIQSELDAAEASLSRDLVRILTHEIMNSLTPVTSLAKTASTLMQNIGEPQSTALSDARAAIETVARRSESLMQFVRSYRAITISPTVRKQPIQLVTLLTEMERLFEAEWASGKVNFHWSRADDADVLIADLDLISQLLINLLRNAAEAAIDFTGDPKVSLHIHANRQGQMVFDVSDNGPGIAAEKVQEIFLPFYTTKAQGTGVGLSLSRQIAIAHGGTLAVEKALPGQTRLRLILP
jgi:two-component system, NtrC family, nitrogen regulation sensor histidine kinase NtrY